MPRLRRRPGRGALACRQRGPDWQALARCGLTIVVYMGVARVREIADALLAGGLPDATPGAFVCKVHTSEQRQTVCTLGTLTEAVQRDGAASPAIIVIGDVVRASPLWPAHGWNVAVGFQSAASARGLR